jgi:hypothetical protein
LVVLLFFKKETLQNFTISEPHTKRIDNIDFISKEDLDRMKRVGILHGKKSLDQPDFNKQVISNSLPNQISSPPIDSKPPSQANSEQPHFQKTNSDSGPSARSATYNRPIENVSSESSTHEFLKQDALKNLSVSRDNVAAQKISNFEIRYERPEGVSENELNSDEKAFYSFYKRSYSSYISKLYSTYEQVAISRPGINRDFEKKHLLVARVDYDQNGNIVTVKILKSSDSDDVHYFFEETLKKLNLPNPPKIFLKLKKEFSIYYQVQIN